MERLHALSFLIGAKFTSRGVLRISRELYALVAHMIYQNVHLDLPDWMGIFPFPVSTISVSGLQFLAFFST